MNDIDLSAIEKFFNPEELLLLQSNVDSILSKSNFTTKKILTEVINLSVDTFQQVANAAQGTEKEVAKMWPELVKDCQERIKSLSSIHINKMKKHLFGVLDIVASCTSNNDTSSHAE